MHEGTRVTADRLLDLDAARNEFAQRLVLCLEESDFTNGLLAHLSDILNPYRNAGRCSVWVDYRRSGVRAQIEFHKDWRVQPTEMLLRRLRGLVGEPRVKLEYV